LNSNQSYRYNGGLTSVAPERANGAWRFPSKGRRAPGEHGVRHLTSREISEAEIAIVEKAWREYRDLGNRLDSNGKA
jgi:hypothetical protein